MTERGRTLRLDRGAGEIWLVKQGSINILWTYTKGTRRLKASSGFFSSVVLPMYRVKQHRTLPPPRDTIAIRHCTLLSLETLLQELGAALGDTVGGHLSVAAVDVGHDGAVLEREIREDWKDERRRLTATRRLGTPLTCRYLLTTR